MDRVDEILLYIQKTNPEMTREKLVHELSKSEYAAKSLIFGAKYDLVAVFSARLYLDNLTLPEYNSFKQSLCACSFRSCTITYRGFHTGALGLSIGRFCRAYYHERNHPDRLLPDV